jgi:hypothetical protein
LYTPAEPASHAPADNSDASASSEQAAAPDDSAAEDVLAGIQEPVHPTEEKKDPALLEGP